MSPVFMYIYTVFSFFLQGIATVYFIKQTRTPRFKSFLSSLFIYPITQYAIRTIFNMIPGVPTWLNIACGFFALLIPAAAAFKHSSLFDLIKISFETFSCYFISDLLSTFIATFITGINLHAENNYNNYNDIYVVATPICTLLLLVCFETILIFRMVRKHINIRLYFILFAITVYQLVLLAAYFQSTEVQSYITALLGLIITTFTMLTDYLIHRYAILILKNEATTKSLQEHQALYEAEYHIIQEKEAQIKIIRSHRHDYMNQLSIIQHMIASNTPISETSSFIDQIIERVKG